MGNTQKEIADDSDMVPGLGVLACRDPFVWADAPPAITPLDWRKIVPKARGLWQRFLKDERFFIGRDFGHVGNLGRDQMLETVEDPWVSLTVIIYRPELMLIG